ncbi:aprataxin and PNK-like factor [Hydractinia symbiolongicarpus]|uniref:aprataxin and PNK-like factor n=1 Tax=Hydractinia symbiolongicarpus TaxID=13093 RepID=UPI00254A7287|nr:aprataxin and PNK-like factor [Hydractinia symbiolongicarpus]XP_057316409.1 aprataxin and PNK-like factor [Hydractinia symbiolongicarpus]
MAFLINTDSNEKISLPDGETEIGRGPFLKVTDKRVSRSHAIVQVKNGELLLKPVHKNPTFHCSAGDDKYHILKKDDWKQLLHGDCISLLPNSLFFTVEVTQDKTQAYSIDENVEDSATTSVDVITTKGDMSLLQSTTALTTVPSSTTSNSFVSKTRTLPSWMLQTESSQPKKKPKPAKKATKERDSSPNEKVTDVTLGEDKISIISKEQEQIVSFSTTDASMSKETASNVAAREQQNPSKPVCPYGSQCYRKNPAHFVEYTHSNAANDQPTDDDDKPECEYGTSCYRKNAQHLRDYKHTKDIDDSDEANRQTRQRTASTKKKSIIDSRSDDDGEPNTYDYDDSFIDDGMTSSESYENDDDDSDFNPGGDKESEDEDIQELVSEAKEFVNNRKS